MMKRYYLLFCLTTFLSYNAVAQGNWGGGIDDQTLHFGFTFQYVSTEYKIFKKSTWRNPVPLEPGETLLDSLNSISSPVSPGFGFGFVTNLRLGTNADLRFTPALVFADRLLDYRYADQKYVRKEVRTTLIDFPLALKMKSDRRKNFRAYILGGAKYSIDIGSSKKNDDSNLILTERFVKNQKNIVWYEAGIGCDLYFEFFKMSPEIKLSNTYRSVLKPEDHPYSAPIDKLFLRNLQFSLYFE